MPEKIVEANVSTQHEIDYKRYSIYVLFRRICPDFRDGLKPVQRRILWTMYHDSKAITTNIKSATTVGAVLKYHPHGDASVYGAMKPMANWFESYQPYIAPKGNWGTFQGDPCAASRYTECKLNKFALDYVIGDIKQTTKAVDWSPNYSKEALEPDYLPVAIPILLVNGVFGIGVGTKAEIPTHNLSEVIQATLRLIEDPSYEPVLIPDHCLPCDIIDTDWRKINRQGFGTYTVRAHIDIEHTKNKDLLVITSIPNLCYLESIIESIGKLVENKTIIQIADAYDESTKDRMRYVIALKPGSDPYFVRDMLYKSTELEQNCRINFIALNGLTPMRMSYSSYLKSFIEFRKLTKYRVYKNMLQQVRTAIHEKEAYIKVLESGEIDHVIDMIKKRKTGTDDVELVEYLIKKLDITDMQASFIINAKIKNLSIAYLSKYKQEAATLNAEKDRLMTFLVSDDALMQDIVRELKEVDRLYGSPRRCKVIAKDSESNIPRGQVQVAVTENNFIKKLPIGVKVGSISDKFKQVLIIDNSDNLIIFDDLGRMFSLPVHKIPFCDKAAAGTDIRYMLKKFTAGISVIFPFSVMKSFDEKNKEVGEPQFFIVTATAKGMIKRMDVADVITAPPSGTVYAKLDQGDKVTSVILTHISNDIIAYSGNKAIRTNVEKIRYLKRNTKGTCLMQVPEGNAVEGLCVIDNTVTDIIVVTRGGKINRINIAALPVSKYKTGNRIIKLASKDYIGSVLGVNANDSIMVKTLYNKEIVIPVNSIIPASSISAGTKIGGFEKGDCVIYALRIH